MFTENVTVTLERAHLQANNELQLLDWRNQLSQSAQKTITQYQGNGWQVQKVVAKPQEITIYFGRN